jgi:hypothetical protein
MKPNTLDIIRTTLRNQSSKYTFMPGAEERIVKALDEWGFPPDAEVPSWIDQAEKLILSEQLTLKKLKELNVTIDVLIGWQEWMIWQDQIP